MRQSIDLLLTNAAQVITCAAPGPKRGAALADVGLMEDGAVAVDDGVIVEIGPAAALNARYTPRTRLDATGKVLCPGFVDCHTHLVFGGERVAEFERKLAGATYQELLAAGGGILSTMRATRAAPLDSLVRTGQRRLAALLKLGTTTVEIKSGYGLDAANELKMLAAIEQLAATAPLDIVPTFLGAHAVPPEYADLPDAYVELVCNELLPAVRDWWARSRFAASGVPFFNDVFCEAGVFDVRQTRRILEAGQRLGLRPKIHADEFVALGGTTLAIELNAISADHLDATPQAEIAALGASATLAVLLPGVNFHLGSGRFAAVRAMIEAGAGVALATDFNPGSAPILSLPLVMAIACRYQRLTPAEALNAATINAAYAIGLGDRLGSLEAGKQADVLIVNAPDYRHLVYWLGENLVEGVVKRGEVMSNA
ncbi:MAG TPA: imidazolonepropionase [Caldilinea sp.]|nr:imidazolonepropionase [Anaerolineales bacterium]HRA67814.1 imidazolonepropionase [Caldilinea sp.]